MNDIFTKKELLAFNEQLLGRGAPTMQDGIGYNKADYSTCINYYSVVTDKQLADLSKRLVKYCNTQLKIDRDKMQRTSEYLVELYGSNIEKSLSIEINNEKVILGFKYNKDIIFALKLQTKARYNGEHWHVGHTDVFKVLEVLDSIGVDIGNAKEHVSNSELIKNTIKDIANKEAERLKQLESEKLKKEEEHLKNKSLGNLTEIKFVKDGDSVILKFSFNQKIVNEIKKIDYKERSYNPSEFSWTIKERHLKDLEEQLKNVAYLEQSIDK